MPLSYGSFDLDPLWRPYFAAESLCLYANAAFKDKQHIEVCALLAKRWPGEVDQTADVISFGTSR